MNIVLPNIKNQGCETVAGRRPFIVSFTLLLNCEFSLMSLILFLYFFVCFVFPFKIYAYKTYFVPGTVLSNSSSTNFFFFNSHKNLEVTVLPVLQMRH